MQNKLSLAVFYICLSWIVIGLSGCCKLDQKISYSDIAGTWNYHITKDNAPISSGTVVFDQQNNSFEGVNPTYTFVGSVYGVSLSFVMIVTGEESDGFVRRVDGSVSKQGKRITGVYQNSHDGQIGSFLALKQE